MSLTSMPSPTITVAARADPVGLLELALHRLRPACSISARRPGGTQPLQQQERVRAARPRRARRTRRRVAARVLGRRRRAGCARLPPANPTPGVGGPPSSSTRPVVAALRRRARPGRPAARSRTRTPCGCSSRARARASGRSRTAQPGGVEQGQDGVEVLGVVGVEAVEQLRRPGHHAPRALVVGVERAQRVLVEARRAPPRTARPRARAGRRAAPRGRPRASRACRGSTRAGGPGPPRRAR